MTKHEGDAGALKIQPVILSGGSGTRLWPLSTESTPKQFLALTESRSMLQVTVARVHDRSVFDDPVIIGSARHATAIREQFSGVGSCTPRLILEPVARNTAPAVALAAHSATRGDQLLLVMPSDHLIADVPAFLAGVATAVEYASAGWLVTFGVKAERAEVGYGYICRGQEIGSGVFEVERFVEKPDRVTAETFVACGHFDWNAGIFLFRADVFLQALAEHASPILTATAASMTAAREEGLSLFPDQEAFAMSPPLSIDYAIMEKARRVATVPLHMRWSDVGSWDALYDVSVKDDAANVCVGNTTAVQASGCLLRSDGIRIVVAGVENLVVIATQGEVLVVPRDRAQLVKEAAIAGV